MGVTRPPYPVPMYIPQPQTSTISPGATRIAYQTKGSLVVRDEIDACRLRFIFCMDFGGNTLKHYHARGMWRCEWSMREIDVFLQLLLHRTRVQLVDRHTARGLYGESTTAGEDVHLSVHACNQRLSSPPLSMVVGMIRSISV
jgi:hypothetical protein